jgi:Dolichyl-phosphate-mannose-protein mannosyltransferase
LADDTLGGGLRPSSSSEGASHGRASGATAASETSPESRIARAKPAREVAYLLGWMPVIGLGSVVLYVGWLSLPWPLIHDAPIMHYVAWRIGQGAVPYRDLFDMNFPGVYLLHLVVLKTLGAGDGAWRLFDLLWLALGSLLIATLAAPWGRLAAVGGALFFAAFHLGGGAWQAGQRDFLLCPFLLAGALGVTRWHEREENRALLLGGLALGAGVTVKPHATVFALALMALVLATRQAGRSRWTALAMLAGGLLVVPLAVLSWLASIGGLEAWREIVFHYLLPLYSRLGRAASWTVYRWSLWPAIAVTLAISLGHAVASRRLTFRHAVVLTGLGYGLLHYVGQGKGWEYHLYPLAAFAAVLLFSEVAAVLRTRPVILGMPLVAALAFLVVVLGRTGVVTADAQWIWDKERGVRVLAHDLDERRRPGDLVQVLDTTDGGLHALLRLGIVEPTRFLYDFYFFHDTDRPIIQALRAELIAGLDLSPPRFIVVFRRGWPSGREERIKEFPELARLLAERYVIAVGRADYVVYAKRDGS